MFSSFTLGPPSDETEALGKEIKKALEKMDEHVWSNMLKSMENVLHEETERYILKDNKKCKAKVAALENRRGQIGENKVMAAMNQVLEGFLGMSVMSMKTHTYLYGFLDRLNIELSHRNTMDHETGRLEHVGHDHISTWLEEDTLVVNFVVPKVIEMKPWSPDDQVTRGKAAGEKAKQAIQQLNIDLRTFIEVFPDISQAKMKKIRWVIGER